MKLGTIGGRRTLFALGGALLLCGSCTRERVSDERCVSLTGQPQGARLASATPYLDEPVGRADEVRLVLLGDETGAGLRVAVAERLARKPAGEEFRFLALSTGGAYGAFGAGILQGLHERDVIAGLQRGDTPWRRFDVVTGASTGAMLAPLAYLGRQTDINLMVERYTKLTNDRVFRKRSVLSYLWSSSFYDTSPLRAMLEEIVRPELLSAIGREWRDQRRVLAVLAVNLDSGRSELFDLGRLAAGDGPFERLSDDARRDRFIRALMASAAIPLGFDPIFIDGCMYVDGGVRQHMFVTSEAAVAISEAEGWPVLAQTERRTGQPLLIIRPSGSPRRPVGLYMLVNNDLRLSRSNTRHGLLAIGQRVFSLTVDEGMVAGIDRMAAVGRQLGWRARYADAHDLTRMSGEHDPGPIYIGSDPPRPRAQIAGDNDDLFDPRFMSDLHSLALRRAQVEGDGLWRSPPDRVAPAIGPKEDRRR